MDNHFMKLYVFLVIVASSFKFSAGLQLSTDREHSFTILSGTRTVQFTCPANSTAPPVTFRWFFRQFAQDPPTELLTNIHQTIDGNTMIIDQLRKVDRGIYVIEAIDGAGQKNNCTFTLQIAFPPTFTASLPIERTATDGTRTIINCPVLGFPEPTTTWLKDGLALTPRTTFEINGTKITFLAANRHDDGAYQCNSTNHYGSVISSVITLNVIEEVVFVAAPKSVVYLHEGDPGVFSCNVTGYPPPHLEWHKTFFPEDPVIFNISSVRPSVATFTGPDYAWSELSYASVEMSDHGLYECRANQRTISKSQLFELVISAKPVITSSHLPNVTVLLGNPYTFICNATGFPVPDITWYKNGLEMMASDRYEMSRGVVKMIHTEGPDSGRYSCHASNSVGQADSTITTFFVQGLYFTKQPPAFIFLGVGDSTVLNCSAAGSKFEIVIQWFKNSIKINTPCQEPGSDNCHVYTNGTYLHLKDIRQEDAGNYTCTAKEIGVVLEPHVILTKTKLQILDAPVFETLLPDTTVGGYNNKLEMQCKVTGNPTPVVRWFRDGFELSNDTHRHTSGGRLIFLKLLGSDRGVYVCVAKNDAGEIRQQTNLLFTMPPSALNVTIVRGYSYAIVRWTVDDDGGSRATTLQMELREVRPQLTQWVAISTNISGNQGQYVIQGLDYNASYELNIWAVNDIGSGVAVMRSFKTLSPDNAHKPKDESNTTVTNHGGGGSAMFIIVAAIAIVLIILLIIIFVLFGRCRHLLHGNDDDGQSLVNNLHENTQSHANPVYNMDAAAGATPGTNGLELHDIKLNEETTK